MEPKARIAVYTAPGGKYKFIIEGTPVKIAALWAALTDHVAKIVAKPLHLLVQATKSWENEEKVYEGDYINRKTAQAEVMAAYADGRILTADDVVKVLDLVPVADVKQGQWVPVSLGLFPETNTLCLVVIDQDDHFGEVHSEIWPVAVGWDGERWIDEDGYVFLREVTYWMPVPDLPKGGSEP